MRIGAYSCIDKHDTEWEQLAVYRQGKYRIRVSSYTDKEDTEKEQLLLKTRRIQNRRS